MRGAIQMRDLQALEIGDTYARLPGRVFCPPRQFGYLARLVQQQERCTWGRAVRILSAHVIVTKGLR